MINLAVSSRRVHEVEASTSETRSRNVVGAVSFMAAKLTVAVMVHTDQGTASREFVGAEFAVAIEVHSLHSGSVSAGFVSFGKADFAVAVDIVASTESSQHFARLGDLFAAEFAVAVEVEGEDSVLSAVVASVVVQIDAIAPHRCATAPKPVSVADNSAVEVTVV